MLHGLIETRCEFEVEDKGGKHQPVRDFRYSNRLQKVEQYKVIQ